MKVLGGVLIVASLLCGVRAEAAFREAPPAGLKLAPTDVPSPHEDEDRPGAVTRILEVGLGMASILTADVVTQRFLLALAAMMPTFSWYLGSLIIVQMSVVPLVCAAVQSLIAGTDGAGFLRALVVAVIANGIALLAVGGTLLVSFVARPYLGLADPGYVAALGVIYVLHVVGPPVAGTIAIHRRGEEDAPATASGIGPAPSRPLSSPSERAIVERQGSIAFPVFAFAF